MLTISGTASQYVVINVTGQDNVQLSNQLSLDRRDHRRPRVHQHHRHRQSLGGTNNNGVVNGILVALNDKINLDNTTVVGQVIGGGNQAFQLSGVTLNAPAAVPRPSLPWVWAFWSSLAWAGLELPSLSSIPSAFGRCIPDNAGPSKPPSVALAAGRGHGVRPSFKLT